jgi:hypothetical protein
MKNHEEVVISPVTATNELWLFASKNLKACQQDVFALLVPSC